MNQRRMNPEVTRALARLDAVLPLVSGLKSLGSDEAVLYCRLLHAYVQLGRTLNRAEVTGLVANPERALTNIADHKLIVLDGSGNPSGAYPFTSEVREHRVRVNGVTVHCMCALDALAVSPMFDRPTVIDAHCRVSDETILLEHNGIVFSGGTRDAWFGIDWGAAASGIACADSLCMEMLFLANEAVAREWQAGSPDTRQVFDLSSAVEFAAGFFVPLAEHCQRAA